MSDVSLSGVNEILADSMSLQEGNALVNIKDKFYDKGTINTMLSSVIGLPVQTLNSLEKIADAIDNNPLFLSTINTSLDAKQPKTINGDIITNSIKLCSITTSKIEKHSGWDCCLA
jgi:hypothetical protein